MGLEQAHAAMDSAAQTTPEVSTGDSGSEQLGAVGSNGSNAPDSSSNETSNVLELSKADKFLWEGKEMTPEELRQSMLRQKDYTKKTQAHAEERRKFEEEKRSYSLQREQEETFQNNYEIDIQNVLRDPSLVEKFKEIYPPKYHAALEKSMNSFFGDPNSPKRNESLLEQRLRSVESRFQAREKEIAKSAYEQEVSKNSEILESNISRFSQKYPLADEDSVLARAEYMATELKKDANFTNNFSQLMEKLYKENHSFHENRYKTMYAEKVSKQKQANSRGRDVGRGGATPGGTPEKMKLKDVKNHILGTLGQN